MTQTEMSDRLGCSQSHLCEIMKGDKHPSYEFASVIFKATKIPVDVLMRWQPEDKQAAGGEAA